MLDGNEVEEEVRIEKRMLKVRTVPVKSSTREDASRPSRSFLREEWRIVSVDEGPAMGKGGGAESWRFERAVLRSKCSEG